MTSTGSATIVVVHGAWADGSSWSKVVLPLQRRGLQVVAAPIPLTSLSDDAAALARVLARTQGPLVGVAPGPVLTQRRLTFLEKWAPAHGMSVEEAMEKFPQEIGISRYGRPEEIAELMSFMVSPGAKWLTGASLRMDGGEVKGI